MSETNRYDASDKWQNVSPYPIKDKLKAEYMADVEDAWRDRIKHTGQRALEAACNDHPLAAHAANDIYTGARYDAQQYGPRAVEQTGKDYDRLHDPIIPESDTQDGLEVVRPRER